MAQLLVILLENAQQKVHGGRSADPGKGADGFPTDPDVAVPQELRQVSGGLPIPDFPEDDHCIANHEPSLILEVFCQSRGCLRALEDKGLGEALSGLEIVLCGQLLHETANRLVLEKQKNLNHLSPGILLRVPPAEHGHQEIHDLIGSQLGQGLKRILPTGPRLSGVRGVPAEEGHGPEDGFPGGVGETEVDQGDEFLKQEAIVLIVFRRLQFAQDLFQGSIGGGVLVGALGRLRSPPDSDPSPCAFVKKMLFLLIGTESGAGSSFRLDLLLAGEDPG